MFMGLTMSWSSVLKGLLAVCIFTHLSVSSVESYSCKNEECYNNRCNPIPRTCESSKGCFHLEQKFEAPRTISGGFASQPASLRLEKKGCSKDECTELAFSATMGNRQMFRYEQRCCYSEQCNNESKRVPPPSSQPNGVECPACYSNNGTCNTVSLKCTGAETECIEVIGRDFISRSVIQGMGCATETACSLRNMTVMEHVKIDTYCFSSSPPLRPISSVLTSLFLMRALL
ncbi:protein RoBo-1 isoform X2 [Mesocricetus auratus]|uniref:Protein RoBo-1 isoform X2 n=1 Tax=Mesocricetus auratus TaxID=10036 RepID=A0ABM2XSS2_MESAU|nr:protein RoBo-1 isoform X2 [Mesocricetus auratus]